MPSKRPTTIAEYIRAAPCAAQPHLRRLYAILKGVAPEAEEAIKWGTPFFVEPRFLFAFSAHIDNDNAFALVFRFLVTPVMLFSGVFFPVDQLPALLQPMAWALPLWHGVELVRAVSGGLALTAVDLGHVAVLAAYVGVGWVLARRSFAKRLAS